MCKEDHLRIPRSTILRIVFLLGAAATLAALRPCAAYAGDPTPACSDCHDKQADLTQSIHGQAGLECVSCHTDLASVKEFPHSKPAPVDCGACHEVKVSAEHPPHCADCHGSHAIKKVTGSTRSASAERLSTTCGACHEEIARDYAEGIHGQELKKGNTDVPTCLTCHGGHGIELNKDPNSPVNPKSVAHTCSSCHDNEEIAEKYGLPAQRLETFVGTYHGLANEYGEKGVANCASCHGAHRILPSADPNSSISPAHLASTCGKCHENAGKHFAVGKVHLRDRWEDNPFTYVAGIFYRGMIASMMAVFGIFMAVDLRYRRRLRRGSKAGRKEAGGEGATT